MIKHALGAAALSLALILAPYTALGAAYESVTWEGDAESFASVSGELFEPWDHMLPGDVITGEVDVSNDSGSAAEIFVRYDGSEGMAAEGVDGLGASRLVVSDGEDIVFDGTLDGAATEPVSLGTFSSGDGANLTFELSVPSSLGNHSAMAAVDSHWTFIVMERASGSDVPSGNADAPDEGSVGGGSSEGATNGPLPNTGASPVGFALVGGGALLTAVGFVTRAAMRSHEERG